MTARNIKRAKSARARKKTRKAGEKRPRAPIERESARRLIRLGGTQPQLKDVPRRKGTSLPSLEKFRRSIKVRGTPSARLLREERAWEKEKQQSAECHGGLHENNFK